MRLVALLLLVLARAAYPATSWWINAGCVNTGDGTTSLCASAPGGHGPFQTFGEAVNAWFNAGQGVNDTFILRGVHCGNSVSPVNRCPINLDPNDRGLVNYNNGPGAPDGLGNFRPTAYYGEGPVWLSNGTLNPPLGGSCGPTAPWNCGHALNGTGGQITVRGALAADCSTCGNERAMLGSGTLRSDWSCVANCGTNNAIWSRAATDVATDFNDPVTLPGTYRGQSSATPAQGTDPSILYTIRPRGCSNNPALNCNVDADCGAGGSCIFMENKTELPYAGDDTATPAEGSWSYQCTCNGTHAGDICTPRKVCLTVGRCTNAHLNDGTHGQSRCNGGTRVDQDCNTDDNNNTSGCPPSNAAGGACVDDGTNTSTPPITRGCGADTCNQCQIFVNPPMNDDPTQTILEGTSYQAVTIDHPTGNVTFSNLDFAFSRRYLFKAEDTGGTNHKLGMRWSNVGFYHSQQQGLIAHGFTGGLFDHDVWLYGGRGTSFSNIGTFFVRFFDSTGIQFLYPIMRYGGSAGGFRADGSHQGGGLHGEVFSYGDPPWNVEAYTHTGGNHVSLQFKQITGDGTTAGSGVEVRGGDIGFDTAGNISIDTVTEAWIHGTTQLPIYLHDTQNSVTFNNFTPDASSGRLYWSNALLENFLIRNSGQLGSVFNLTNAAAVNVEGTESNATICHSGTNTLGACTCTGGAPCAQANAAACTGSCLLGNCCSTERNQVVQPDETTNPLITIRNGHFQNCGYACLQIVGNHQNNPALAACTTDTNNCFIAPNQIGDPGGVIVSNVTMSGTAQQTEAGGQSRGIVLQNCSAFTGSCSFTNVLVDNMTNETFVTRSGAGEALANMVTAGKSIDWTEQSRLASTTSYRYGSPTMPNANATTQPSGGTLDTKANFTLAFPTMEPNGFTANATFAGEWHSTVTGAQLCRATNASAGADIEGDPRPETRSGASCFDEGADQYVSTCSPARLSWADPAYAVKTSALPPLCRQKEWWR